MSSNYPPGVTGNEPEITGEVNLPAEYTVTFKVKLRVPGEGRMDATEAETIAIMDAAECIEAAIGGHNAPCTLFDNQGITIEVQ